MVEEWKWEAAMFMGDVGDFIRYEGETHARYCCCLLMSCLAWRSELGRVFFSRLLLIMLYVLYSGIR